MERAFMLAESGRMNSLSDLRRQLTAESYDVRQLEGPQLIKKLRSIMHALRTGEPIPEQPPKRVVPHRRRTTVRRDC